MRKILCMVLACVNLMGCLCIYAGAIDTDLVVSENRAAEKRKILQDDYDIQMTRTMREEMTVMCNLSKGVMEKSWKKGMEKGIEEGLEKGMEKGMAQGHAERALADLRSLMETLGLTIEQAMAALKISENERQMYLGLLERQ